MNKIFEDFFDEVDIDSEDIKHEDILSKTPEYKINLFLFKSKLDRQVL